MYTPTNIDEAQDLSPLERAQLLRERRVLHHERRVLLAKIDQTVNAFDTAVLELRREKFRLDADLKAADLKLLTLHQELQILKGFEEVSWN